MEPNPLPFPIPDELQPLAIPLQSFLKSRPQYQGLLIGAFVFAHARHPAPDTSEPRLLLLKRATTDSNPNRWEVPAGAVDVTDNTILHGVARELFEETKLGMSEIVAKVDGGGVWSGVEFTTSKGLSLLKLSFLVAVAEVPPGMTPWSGDSSDAKIGGIANKISRLEDVPVVLSPTEHQDYAWVTETEVIDSVRGGTGEYTFISNDQAENILLGFRRMRERSIGD